MEQMQTRLESNTTLNLSYDIMLDHHLYRKIQLLGNSTDKGYHTPIPMSYLGPILL